MKSDNEKNASAESFDAAPSVVTELPVMQEVRAVEKSGDAGLITRTLRKIKGMLEKQEAEAEKAARESAWRNSEEGQKWQAQFESQQRVWDAEAAHGARVALAREEEAKVRWAIRRIAKEYLRKHPCPTDGKEFSEILYEVINEREALSSAFFRGQP